MHFWVWWLCVGECSQQNIYEWGKTSKEKNLFFRALPNRPYVSVGVGVGIKYSRTWITASHWCGSTTFCKPTTIFQPKVLILACCIGLFSNWNGALSFGVESVDLYSLLGSFKVVFLTFLLLNFRMCIVWENLQIERMTILVLSFQRLIRYCSKPSQNHCPRC